MWIKRIFDFSYKTWVVLLFLATFVSSGIIRAHYELGSKKCICKFRVYHNGTYVGMEEKERGCGKCKSHTEGWGSVFYKSVKSQENKEK